MTRRQRDDLKFALLLAFSLLCMMVDYVDPDQQPKQTQEDTDR